ncbi:MAG: putative toxin-antitoxin system toxin component, PIN family [Caldilineaceae bacterium]
MRLVIDTNIFISALITRDTPPDLLYQAWKQGLCAVVTSPAQLSEMMRVSAYDKLQRYFTPADFQELLTTLDAAAEIVTHLPLVHYSPDPDDNLIIATAIAGSADYIVSGDKRHMLALKRVENIGIINIREALELF